MLYSVKASVLLREPLELRNAYEALAGGLSALCQKVVKLGNSYLAICKGSVLVEVVIQAELQKYDILVEAKSSNPQDLVEFFESLNSAMKAHGFPIALRIS